MPYTTLISAAELVDHLLADQLDDPAWAIVDCRFSLDATERGRRDYQAAHIPGAIYAHLGEDLSGPVIAGVTGRHPGWKLQLQAVRGPDDTRAFFEALEARGPRAARRLAPILAA